MVSPGHGAGDSAGKTGGTRGTAPDLLYVSPASLGGSDAGAYSICPASVCRVKMMPGLSLGLSSELFAELGWVSPGALSSCPSAIKIPGWERGGSCRSSRGRALPGYAGAGTAGKGTVTPLPCLPCPELFLCSFPSWFAPCLWRANGQTPGCELHRFQKGGSAWSLCLSQAWKMLFGGQVVGRGEPELYPLIGRGKNE